ncbi:MAG: hypothetical protein R6X31_10700 [Anaerolineae bacterium]
MRPGATRALLAWFSAVVVVGYWNETAGAVVAIVGLILLTIWAFGEAGGRPDENADRLLHDLQERRINRYEVDQRD